MSLIQLPKVIELVNTLSLKVNELEQEVKQIKEDMLFMNRMQQTKPAPKKND